MTDFKENKKINSTLPCFTLYSTSACHLCEEAISLLTDLHEQMLVSVQQRPEFLECKGFFAIHEQDISDDSMLIEQLGRRIPVLMFPGDQAELDWPFDIQQAYEFILPRLNA